MENLQKQLQQQESLLNGYQQENERLYKEAKDKANDMKKIESKMFEENQKLGMLHFNCLELSWFLSMISIIDGFCAMILSDGVSLIQF